MASNLNQGSRSIPRPSGLRTPSPTKSRLPLGSALPQRTASTRRAQDITLHPLTSKVTVPIPGPSRRPTSARTRLQQSNSQLEHHVSSNSVGTKAGVPGNGSAPLRRTGGQPVCAPPESESNQPIVFSRDTLDSRIELLHLHVIHKTASQNHLQWQDHAFQHYKEQFEDLQKRSEGLNKIEIELLTQQNVAAILSWSNQGFGLEKHFQTLSDVIDEIEQMTSDQGKYTIAIQAFEHWIATVTSLQSQRATIPSRKHLNIVEGLGDGWLNEIESLQVKIVNCADSMLSLAEVKSSGSDIYRSITVVSEMLKNMLVELDMVLNLEATITKGEKDWVDDAITNITQDLSKGLKIR